MASNSAAKAKLARRFVREMAGRWDRPLRVVHRIYATRTGEVTVNLWLTYPWLCKRYMNKRKLLF
jgi:hypothetical protein